MSETLKNNFAIETYVGIGPIRFGMSIAQVRNAVGESARPFLKASDDDLHTDSFPEAGIHVFYKQPGICNAVECFKPESNPIFQGEAVFAQTYLMVKEWFMQLDPALRIDYVSFTSFVFGVGVYAPMDKIESLIVFERGYYNGIY